MQGTAWLILPTFNEAENIGAVVEAARARRSTAARRGRTGS